MFLLLMHYENPNKIGFKIYDSLKIWEFQTLN